MRTVLEEQCHHNQRFLTTMRSGRIGLSDYTTRRLAELQALRESADHDDSPTDRSSRTQHPVSPSIDDGLGPSRTASSGSDGVTSPGSPDPPTTKVSLPSALLESKRAALISRVGYTSLALPPDGAYRPLRGTLGETNESHFRYQTGSSGKVDASTGSSEVEGEIEPLPFLLPPVTTTTTNARQYGETKWNVGVTGKGEEEKRKRAMTLDSSTNGSTDDGKKSLAIKVLTIRIIIIIHYYTI